MKIWTSNMQLISNRLGFAQATLLCLMMAGSASAQLSESTGSITKSFTEPIEQSIAASAETGIITLAMVEEGDRVAVGDVLATINHKVLRQSLAIAEARAESEARLDAAKSQLEMADSQLKAVQDLVEGGHTNRYEVEQRRSAWDTANAEYRSAEDELKLNELEVLRIEAQIQDRIIKSPIDGFVTEIHKQLGENVSNNEPEYATIVKVDQLKVRFYQDNEQLSRIRKGDTLTIYIGSHREPKEAIVTYVSPVIDPDSGLGRVDVTIDNEDLAIKSGVICFWSQEAALSAKRFNFSDFQNTQR